MTNPANPAADGIPSALELPDAGGAEQTGRMRDRSGSAARSSGAAGPAVGSARRLDAPWRYEFAQLVRQLACTPATGRGALDHHDIQHRIQQTLRFSSPAHLRFPPGEVAHCVAIASEDPLQPLRHQLSVNFLGLVGPSGALPVAYTERLYQLREHQRETATAQFFDIFQHRQVALFFSAMTRGAVADLAARQTPAFTRLSCALAALPEPAVEAARDRHSHATSADNTHLPTRALLYYAGSLRLRPLPAVALERIVASFFHVPAKMQGLQGGWLDVEAGALSALGSARLDGSLLLGQRCWDAQAGLRLTLGPLRRAQFLQFLPGHDGFRALQALIDSHLPALLSCTLELLIERSELPASPLGDAGAAADGLGRLGWSQRLAGGGNGIERFPLRLRAP